MPNKKGFAPILIIGLVAATLALIGVFYLKQNRKSPPSSQLNTQLSPSPLLPMVTKDDELTPEEAKKILPLDNETANWKTYRNNANGYSLKYSSSLQLNASDPDYTSFLIPASKSEFLNGIQIGIHNNPKSLTVEEWANSQIQGGGLKFQKFSLGDLNGVKTELPAGGQPREDYLFKNGNKIYDVEVSGAVDYLRPYFNEMMKTFKFTQ